MINECEEHGYYRDDFCPVCGEKGKFVMSDYEVEKMGRTLAAILRHGKFDLEMSPQGFVDMRDIVDTVRGINPRMKWLRPHHIEALALTDPKGRYQVVGHKVRATYGHTVKLDLHRPTDDVPDHLYYPVSPDAEEIIMETGIMPVDRAMVHLSGTYRDAVRAGSVRMDDVAVLDIDTKRCADAGFPIGKAARSVYLCDRVPPACLSLAEEPEDKGDSYRW